MGTPNAKKWQSGPIRAIDALLRFRLDPGYSAIEMGFLPCRQLRPRDKLLGLLHDLLGIVFLLFLEHGEGDRRDLASYCELRQVGLRLAIDQRSVVDIQGLVGPGLADDCRGCTLEPEWTERSAVQGGPRAPSKLASAGAVNMCFRMLL